MKTISTLTALALIVLICIFSATLYLRTYYNLSAILTLLWVVSTAFWIRSNGFYEEKRAVANN